MSRMTRPDGPFIELIKRSGSADKTEALNAQHELALALELPLRKGVLVGDILDNISKDYRWSRVSAWNFH